MGVVGSSSTLYVEAVEESFETAFQSFEVVSNASIESLLRQPRMSGATMIAAREMLEHGYVMWSWLGADHLI